ncbi:his operon leader peptide [Xenorhabdus nematophila]|nr:his operon leader peptide [Xenorhabdus nematophila]AYA42488.1 his operon leader peptide [Xenorhabdus nematophila]MBA0019482.1 his operon leader peptide [Xenorhabdus nematophila]MCB4424259.1 his operon leader peptide [Xenorhabdus nematophila]QNJ38361.1 his operon leader peptide [Xenorhabdus nematophila]
MNRIQFNHHHHHHHPD